MVESANPFGQDATRTRIKRRVILPTYDANSIAPPFQYYVDGPRWFLFFVCLLLTLLVLIMCVRRRVGMGWTVARPIRFDSIRFERAQDLLFLLFQLFSENVSRHVWKPKQYLNTLHNKVLVKIRIMIVLVVSHIASHCKASHQTCGSKSWRQVNVFWNKMFEVDVAALLY